MLTPLVRRCPNRQPWISLRLMVPSPSRSGASAERTRAATRCSPPKQYFSHASRLPRRTRSRRPVVGLGDEMDRRPHQGALGDGPPLRARSSCSRSKPSFATRARCTSRARTAPAGFPSDPGLRDRPFRPAREELACEQGSVQIAFGRILPARPRSGTGPLEAGRRAAVRNPGRFLRLLRHGG